MHAAIQSGVLENFSDRLRSAYRERARLLYDILSQEERIVIKQQPLGGYFLWVQFPQECDTENFLHFCKSKATFRDLRFLPGVLCDPVSDEFSDTTNDSMGLTTDAFRSCARLCFAHTDDSTLVAGARRLVSAFQEYMENLSPVVIS